MKTTLEEKGKRITSKTHRFISVRKFPSDYIIKKFHKHEPRALKQFHDHVQIFIEFQWRFTEVAIKKDNQYFVDNYFLGCSDAAKEEVHELTGILAAEAGNTVDYCIPKTKSNERIYDWMIEYLDKSKLKYKVLKKTSGTYGDYGPTRFFRDMYKTPDKIREKL